MRGADSKLAALLSAADSFHLDKQRTRESATEKTKPQAGRRNWAKRITLEAQKHDVNCFVTLSYNNKHLPPNGSINYAHLEKFHDRLRSANRRRGLESHRYYTVATYDDRTMKPIYYACLFGLAFTNDRIIIEHTTTTLLWTSPTLDKAWGYGNAIAQALTPETAFHAAHCNHPSQRSDERDTRQKNRWLQSLAKPREFMSRNLARTPG